MKIDKSKLMKRAWEIAEIGFLNACIRSLDIDERYRGKLLRYDLNSKRNFINAEHIQKRLVADFTKKDFFSESLKIAWTDAKATVKREFEKNLEKIEQQNAVKRELAEQEKIAETNKNAPKRELIPAEKYEVGQKLSGFIITGLGQTFKPHADMFSWGITPDTETVQYAYFN